MSLMRAGAPLLLWVAGAWAAVVPLTVVDQKVPVLTVDTGGNTALTLTLRNDNTTPVPVRLSMGDFTHPAASGPGYSLGTASTISGVSDADNARLAKQQLAAGETLTIKVAVSKFWEAGESSADLTNVGEMVTTLRALRTPAAYNVHLDPKNSEALFAPQMRAIVRIVNDDSATYRFRWQLKSQGNSQTDPAHPTIELPAKGTVDLDITAAKPPMSFVNRLLGAGTLKDDVMNGDLLLHPMIESETGIPPQSAVILPLTLRFRLWSTYLQQFWAFFWTLIFLSIGGVASLCFRYFIPNAMGAIKLKNDLAAMKEKLSGIGTDLPSQYRVLLSSRITFCRSGVSDMSWLFPSFATQLSSAQSDARMFGQWLEVSYAVSLGLQATGKLIRNGIPPTMLQLIQEKCDLALQPILTGFTTPEELEAMRTNLRQAQAYVQALTTGAGIPDLEALIKDRESGLTAQELTQLTVAFPIFAGLLTQVAAQIPKLITAADYLDRDTFSLKAALLKQYRDLAFRAGATVLPPPQIAMAAAAGGQPGAAQPADTALDRINRRYTVFIQYVEPDASDSLGMAQLFVTEMRQDFYPKALLTEVQKNPPALEIRAEPACIRIGTPVHLSLRFLRQAVNGIAALQEWSCHWNFGDGSEPETGWDVYHNYESLNLNDPAGPTATVTLVDLKGNVIQTSAPITRTLTRTATWSGKSKFLRFPIFTPLAKIEASRLAFVLLIALLGVFTTARGKVETMGVFEAAGALIALGFGVDTLKNLITQTPAEKGT